LRAIQLDRADNDASLSDNVVWARQGLDALELEAIADRRCPTSATFLANVGRGIVGRAMEPQSFIHRVAPWLNRRSVRYRP
jgi:hypothetical protein